LQRDLTDSTVLRNIGVPLAHTFIGIKAIEAGLKKLVVNTAKIVADLKDNWIVVAEAIQTVLRREGYPQPYEALKALTRGETVDQMKIHGFIDGLDISGELKAELKKITPFNFTGIAE
jgi:adenylosuccinate lyase